MSRLSSVHLATAMLFIGGACTDTRFNNSHPQISANPAVIDFGTLPTGPAVTRQLTLTNSGTLALTISRTAFTGDTANAFAAVSVPSRIAAGDTALLTISFTPPAVEGLYGAALQITSNADNAPLLTVPVSARISNELDAGPSDDAGPADAGPNDAGIDAGPTDAGIDAGPADAGIDAGPADAGVDAGPADAGPAECPPGLELCSGVCTDTQHDRYNCGACGGHCFGTGQTCSMGMCAACAPTEGYTVLASDQALPYDLAIDATHAYWTAESSNAVAKVSLAGGVPTTIVSSSSLSPQAIAVDSTSVYFGSLTQYSVYKTGKNGGGLLTIGASGAWASKIAVGPTAVYWLTTTTGALMRAGLNGGAVTTLVAAPNDGSYEMVGLDATSVYWLKHSFDDSSPGGIYKVSQSGGTPVTIMTGQGLRDGAVDGTNVYWTAYETAGKVSTSGGTPVTFGTSLGNPRNMTVHGNYAYWSEGGTDGDLMECDSSIRKVAINGGPIINVTYGQYSAWAVRADDNFVYWTDLYGGQILRTPQQ